MMVPDSVTPTGERAKLLDFGIARIDNATDGDGAEGQSLTQSQILGTPAYMSPEQCRGVGAISAKSDVYSLGVMLYELLAGRPPFVSRGAGELINMHLSRAPTPLHEVLPDVPADLSELVRTLLHKEPAGRPTMPQVVAALEQLQARQGAAGGPLVRIPEPVVAASESEAELRESLVDILGAGGPVSSSTDASPRRVASPMAYSATLGSQRDWTPPAAQTAAARPSDPALPVVAAAQMEVMTRVPPLQSPRTSETGESEKRLTPRTSGFRWDLGLGILIGGGIVLAATRGLLPPPSAMSPVPRPVFAAAPAAAPIAPPMLPKDPGSLAGPPSNKGTPIAPLAQPTVSWEINTLPSGARVLRADTGEQLGTTPWMLNPGKAAGALSVRLAYPGYGEKLLLLDYAQDCRREETLPLLTRATTRKAGVGRGWRFAKGAQPAALPKDDPDHAPAAMQFKIIE